MYLPPTHPINTEEIQGKTDVRNMMQDNPGVPFRI